MLEENLKMKEQFVKKLINEHLEKCDDLDLLDLILKLLVAKA